MSRLYDRIMVNGLAPTSWQLENISGDDGREWHKSTILSLKNVQIITADNIASYLYTGTAQERWCVKHDFPCLAPVFDRFWIEYVLPHKIWTASQGVLEYPNHWLNWPHACGLLFEFEKIEIGWDMFITMFLEINKGDPVKVPLIYRLEIGCNGEVLRYAQGGITGYTYDPPDELANILQDIGTLIWAGLLALSFLHCKNVKLITNEPPVKLNKAYQKKRGKPLVKYYTLEIEPMKQVLRREGQVEKLGLKKALHICRGHFKDYTERPLFGKHHGLYWWDSHARGNLSEGAVIKDYRVNLEGHDAKN